MFSFLRHFLREIRSKVGRYRFISFLIRNLPGESGFIIRERIHSKWFKSVGKNLRINEGVHIRNIQNMVVGEDVYLGAENFFQAAGGIEIGNHSMLGPGVKIWTQNHKFEDLDTPIIDQGYDFKKVVIGDNVWIGANVFIMPGAEIGDGCIVSAGSVVGAKKIPPYSILAGNPARKIGTRERKEEENTEQDKG